MFLHHNLIWILIVITVAFGFCTISFLIKTFHARFLYYLSWCLLFSLSLAHNFNLSKILGTSKYFSDEFDFFFLCYLSHFLPFFLFFNCVCKKILHYFQFRWISFLSISMVRFGLYFVNEFNSCSIYINLCFFIIDFIYVFIMFFKISYNIFYFIYIVKLLIFFIQSHSILKALSSLFSRVMFFVGGRIQVENCILTLIFSYMQTSNAKLNFFYHMFGTCEA